MEFTDVDIVAEALFPVLMDQFDDVALIRDAISMAFSELCQNGVEHGANALGCVAVARRLQENGNVRLTLAIGDLGIGIPKHLRQQHPEYVVDEHAIGIAISEGVSGTPRPDRGEGFRWVLKETLASAATGAEMVVRSGRGVFQRRIAGTSVDDHGYRAPSTPGTWIAHDWISVR